MRNFIRCTVGSHNTICRREVEVLGEILVGGNRKWGVLGEILVGENRKWGVLGAGRGNRKWGS